MLDNKITHLFKTNLRFKDLCIDMLSRQYGFSTKQINTYKNILNFKESYLVYNRNVVWDLKTIENTKDKIDWSGFYNFKGVVLNLSFFKKYEAYINFRSIYLNQNIDWSNQLLDTYADRWDWEWLMMRPMVAQPRNIQRYYDNYHWDKFSSNRHLKLTEELIDNYLDKWNWIKLSSNPALKLDRKLVGKYENYLCFNGLSRNPFMVPFILAYPNDFGWDWHAFVQNPGVVFGETLIQFLIKKFKPNHPYLKRFSEEWQTDYSKSIILKLLTNSITFDRDIWFTESFQKQIPWKELIERKPKVLTTEEIEEHLNLDNYEKNLPSGLIEKLSKEYIIKNIESLLKYRWSLFRRADIDESLLRNHATEDDWFQLAFNQQFDWSLEFLVKYLDKFESNYGLSQNEKIYESLFGNANNIDIENLLKAY